MSNLFRHDAESPAYSLSMTKDTKEILAPDPIRLGLGMRLKAAREHKSLTQDDIAKRFSLNKATVSAWETGRGDPGVYRLRELAKLYDVSADALLWEDSLSTDAMKLAAEFDGLSEKQKSTLRALWMAYVQESGTDADVEDRMPITKGHKNADMPGAASQKDDRRAVQTDHQRKERN